MSVSLPRPSSGAWHDGASRAGLRMGGQPMNVERKRFGIVACGVLGLVAASVHGAPVVLDSFEGGSEGHFSFSPTLSGTNRNISSATADSTTGTAAQGGVGSEQINITPLNPGTSTDFPANTFRMRFLSGDPGSNGNGGTPAFNVNIGPDGYVGYFLKTTTPNLTASIGLDDGAALEQGTFRSVISDGQWHLYQWNLDAPSGEFTGFAGTGPNGKIDGPTVTIDSLFFQGPTSSSPTPVIFLDTVAYNTSGDLSTLAPEPGSLGLLGAGGTLLLRRRRRAT